MRKIRINVYRVVEAMVRRGKQEALIEERSIEDLRKALRSGNWELLSRRDEMRRREIGGV